MNLMVAKRFIRNSVSRVEVVVFRVRGGWENVYVMSSPKYSNRCWMSVTTDQRVHHNLFCAGVPNAKYLSH